MKKIIVLVLALTAFLTVLAQDCNVPNCKTCVTGNPDKCDTCNVQFYVSNDRCSNCIPHCDKCSTSRSCTTCEVDYKLVSGGWFGTDACKVSRCRVQSCISCSEIDAEQCTKCETTAYLTTDGKCPSCSENCKTCQSSSETCTSCFENYKLDSSTCVVENCQAANCTTCEAKNADLCAVCFVGFFLDPISKTCQKCSDNCATCEFEANICQSCHPNYELNVATGVCEVSNCTVPGCLKCNTTNHTICEKCDFSKYVEQETGQCGDCPQGCLYCESSTACKTCEDRYALNADALCDQCSDNCASCKSKTVCDTCDKHTSLIGGVCIVCPSNCESCTSSTKCSTCEDQYGLNLETGLCEKCPDNCLSCKGADNCNACLAGFGVNATTGLCDSCPENCEACEGAYKCTQCASHFGINSTTYLCDLCPRNCEKCSGSYSCDKCKDHTAYNEASCACEVNDCQVPNCTQCNVDYPYICVNCDPKTFLNARSYCDACIARCTSCKDAKTCTTCDPNYSFNSWTSQCETSTCQVDNCAKCEVTNAEACTSCNEKFFLQDSTHCSSCPLNCLSCKDGASCDTCATGHEYKTDANECECKDSPNCKTCNGETTSNCDVCKNGFFLDSTDSQCKNCMQNCVECTDGTSCKTCAENYAWNENTKSCMCSTSANCKTCDSADSSKCETCQDTYFKSPTHGTCFQCPLNCVKCSDIGACDDCIAGHVYKAESNSCECQGASNCQTCDSKDNSKCSACKSGFYLDGEDSQCKVCSKNCEKCSNANTCDSCTEFYKVEEGTCVVDKCQVKNCETCIKTDAYQCEACASGTFLNGTECSQCKESPRCSKCDNEGKCTECGENYKFYESKCYFKCSSEGCALCYESADKCDTAEERFFVAADGKVEACPNGCLNCNSTTTCNKCQANTTWQEDKTECLSTSAPADPSNPSGSSDPANPSDTPSSNPGDSSNSNSKVWIWILAGLGVIFIIALAMVLWARNRKPVEEDSLLDAPLYGQQNVRSSGILQEKKEV